MSTHQGAQGLRQRKYQMEVRYIQEFPAPLGQPTFCLVALALGAVAVLARMIGVLPMSAAVTAVDLTTEDGGATVTEIVQCPSMAVQHRRAILLQIGIASATQHVRDFQHDLAPQL
jgi:hypothetical protein